ncbi:MAG: biotin--[acetyl-CoA-carboxylase] ligase [bacterium]
MLDAVKLKKYLEFENYALLDSVDSTNDYVSARIAEGKNSLLAVADSQSNGKGRFSRKWISEKGGLYFSFTRDLSSIGYPLQLYPIACSIGVLKYLESLSIPLLRYKWPNDILVKDRKISGILCELTDKAVIAGIGVNINIKNIPNELSYIATSVYFIKRREYSLTDAVVSIVKGIGSVENAEQILNFLDNSGMKGRRIVFQAQENQVEGIVHGFKENGEIILKTDKGHESFIAGDVSFVRDAV